jgi:hypothetical protein
MCDTCDATEELAAAGVVLCGRCDSTYDARCAQGHWYCPCAELMQPYDGGPPTRCFRCAAGI